MGDSHVTGKQFSFQEAVSQLGITFGQAGILGRIDGNTNTISNLVWNTSSAMIEAASAGKVGLTYGDFGKGAKVAGQIAGALHLEGLFKAGAKAAGKAIDGMPKFGKEKGTKTSRTEKSSEAAKTEQKEELKPEIKETMYRVATEAFRYYSQFNNFKGFVSDVERPEGVSNVRYGVTTIHKNHFGINDEGQDVSVDKISGLKVIVTFTYDGHQYQVESNEPNPKEENTNNG